MTPSSKKRTRRTQEQLIADLEAKITAIKAKAERQQAKRDPALRHVASAAKAMDKAIELSQDKVLRSALTEARLTLTSCLSANGAAVPSGKARDKQGSRRSAVATDDLPGALLRYVKDHPGQRSEEIAVALETDTATIRGPMKRLIGLGKVRTVGQRRGMSYYPEV